MKKFTMLVLAASLAACGSNNGTASLGTTTATLPDSVVVTAASTESMDSAQFLADAWRDGQNEIRLSQLALQRASDDRVKKFAQAMIDQHTKLNNELSSLAQTKNITLPNEPTADQDADSTRLAAAAAADVDRIYMQINVAAHDKDAAAFRQQAKQGNDADIRKLANAALPLLKLHLAAAEEINGLIDPNAFLVSAYEDGLAEIQLGQLALQKAANADVKAFAQRMIDDHTQANNQIAALAQQAGTTLPSSPGTDAQSVANELAAFSGADFDRAYMDVNLVAHLKDVRQFRRQSEQGTNDAVKSFAQKTLPVLAEHLIRAYQIDRQVTPSFAYNAYQDGNAEVAISHLALLKSTNGAVRTFAQRMIDDHSKANNQLAAIASQKSIALPEELSPLQTLAFVALNALSGEEFDRAYARFNVRAHGEDVSAFTAQAQQASDADIKNFAQTNLPVLTDHLAQANALNQSVGASSSTTNQPPAPSATTSPGTPTTSITPTAPATSTSSTPASP